MHTYIPNINLIELEGTYLIWLDFRKLNKTEEELEDIIFNKAGILLNKVQYLVKKEEVFSA